MSSFSVRVERVRSVQPHPNADRLDIIQVLDWFCVVQKDSFKTGDLCIYFPIDSILPISVEEAIFGPNSAIKLHKARVKTIKLRGSISQGLAVHPNTLRRLAHEIGSGLKFDLITEGDDLTLTFGVTKYEPPDESVPVAMRGDKATKKQTNPHFRKYTDIENAKNHPHVFTSGELVYVTEKIHGTNFRAGYVPTQANTLFKKVLKLLRLLPSYEFVYGSRTVQLQDDAGNRKRNFYQKSVGNVYKEAVDNYNLRDRLKPGEVVYGEVFGAGVQKGYTYGLNDERGLVLFDVANVSPSGEMTFLDAPDFSLFCGEREFDAAPALYIGPFDRDEIKSLAKGESVLAPEQKVREGVVVKPLRESYSPSIGRKVLKFINDDYLLKDQSDFH